MRYAIGEYMQLFLECETGDEPQYVRGHVSEQQARDALNNWEAGFGEGPIAIRHVYGRFVFAPSDAEYDQELRVYEHKQRGAFAMTEVTPIPSQRQASIAETAG